MLSGIEENQMTNFLETHKGSILCIMIALVGQMLFNCDRDFVVQLLASVAVIYCSFIAGRVYELESYED